MEIQTLPPKHPTTDYRANVDTSSPFRSVKEAVAIFGERFLTPEIYTPKTFSFPKQESTISTSSWSTTSTTTTTFFSPSPQKEKTHQEEATKLEVTLKRLESELEETKSEIKLLKERESETEVALASLNAELHMNMSKMAQAEAEAAAAAKEANRGSSLVVFGGRESGEKEEESRKGLVTRKENSPSLAQILGQKDGFFGGGNGRKMMKKKPIVPLLGDLFSKKKGSTRGIHNPLYNSSSFVHWN